MKKILLIILCIASIALNFYFYSKIKIDKETYDKNIKISNFFKERYKRDIRCLIDLITVRGITYDDFLSRMHENSFAPPEIYPIISDSIIDIDLNNTSFIFDRTNLELKEILFFTVDK